VRQFLDSPGAATGRKRNQLIWKFVASEEDYVSQLTVLNEEFRQQCEIAACSRKPPITLEQTNAIFRNSDELLLFHQLFLRGLHSRIEKWPVVVLGKSSSDKSFWLLDSSKSPANLIEIKLWPENIPLEALILISTQN